MSGTRKKGGCHHTRTPNNSRTVTLFEGEASVCLPSLYVHFGRPGSLSSLAQMDEAESQSPLVDNGQQLPFVAKRTTPEEPNAAPDAKRLKISDDGEAPPIGNLPPPTRIVPFPEKVCSVLKSVLKPSDRLEACSFGRTKRRDRFSGCQQRWFHGEYCHSDGSQKPVSKAATEDA